ncbi:hypothetical protein GF345_01475 [Candidatus Woesearchaeota archaeon]|nr:hypothetical protein [Candidatus Woesearchaeota archaeon]
MGIRDIMAKEDNITISLDAAKKNWHWIALGLILAFGLYLRSYHLDYPVVGYHNWKESRYLQESRNFAENGFFEHGFFIAEHDYPTLKEDSSGAHGGEFPSLPILISIFFMIFGEGILLARIIILLLGLGCIAAMYLLVRALFEREDLALASAFAVAMMPLFVFFTHNVQQVNISLFLMLIGAYFYVRWVKKDSGRDMILSALFIMLAGITKYDFLVIGIPMLFIFPWKRLIKLKKLSSYAYPYIASAAIFLLIIVQYIYFNIYIPSRTSASAVSSKLIDVSVIFTSQWWTAMRAYTADNYTILGFVFALFGIGFFLLFYRKTLGYRFMAGYLAGVILYFFIMASKMGGHSYHQFAIAPFFAFMIAYCFVVVATNISKMMKAKQLKPAIVIVLFLILYFPSTQAWERQFNTQFYGLDVAGKYINEHSDPDERIIHSGHQDYGLLWYADRKSTGGGVPSLEDIRMAEQDLNVRWIFLYQWGFSVMQDQERWDYIKEHYSLRQIGLLNQKPLYMLFEKGGSFNESMLQNITGRPDQKAYELTKGDVVMQWIDFD